MFRSRFSTVFTAVLGMVFPSIALAQTETLNPPFGTATTQVELIVIIATILQVMLGFVGAAALLMFVWGGFHMIFSGGNEEKIKKGRDTLVWAAIGLAIVLSSYAILSYTFKIFQTATGG